MALGIWLYKQSLLHEVKFRVNTRAVSANLSSTNDPLSLHVMNHIKQLSVLNCDKLVLSAGP